MKDESTHVTPLYLIDISTIQSVKQVISLYIIEFTDRKDDHMDTKHLNTFKVAAETLNFTQTASILNFAQSSVTAQIKSLEEELGQSLFERLGRRLILTEAGKDFKLYAEQMINLNEEAKMKIDGNTGPFGTLTIGAQESQCTYRLPWILKAFKEKFPNLELIFKPAHSDEKARKQLMEGTLDVAFIMDISKPEHSLAEDKSVVLKDIEQETLLLTEAGCSYRTLLERSCKNANVYPINKFEFGSIEAIKQCIIAGIGVAALPTMVVDKDIKAGRMKELSWESDIPPVHTHIAWHKDKLISPPVEAFIELTHKYFSNPHS